MTRMVRVLALAALLLVSTGHAAKAGPAATIAPMIDAQTFAVIRVDVAKIRVDQLNRWLTGSLSVPPNVVQEPLDQLSQWQRSFLGSGAREIYVIFSLSDIPRTAPPILVPVPAGVDAQAVVEALRLPFDPNEPGEGGMFGSDVPIRTIGSFVAAAADPTIFRRLETTPPAARPNMAAAFAAADMAVQAVLVPSEEQRQMVAGMLAEMRPPVPTMDSDVLLRGVQWASLGVQVTPIPSLKLTVQSHAPEDARKLHTLITELLEFAAQDRNIRRVVPYPKPLITMITPAVQGNRLVTGIPHEKVVAFTRTQIFPALGRARHMARQAVSMANLRACGQATAMYRHDNDGRAPAGLQALVQTKLIEPKHLRSPHSAENQILSYVYIRPPEDVGDDVILAYEDPAPVGLSEAAVLFNDMRVLTVPVDDSFWRMISHAKKLSSAAYGDLGQ